MRRRVPVLLSLLILLTSSASLTPAGTQDADGGRYWYRGVAGGTETISATGSTAWVARAIEATAKPLADYGGAYGLVLHRQDDGNYYLFIYSFKSIALRIYKRVGGAYTLLSSVPFTLNLGDEHRLRAEADESGNLSLLVDGKLELTASDTTFRKGQVGLRVYNGIVDFDDVLVKDAGGGLLLYDDFEDGNANGWTGGSGWAVVEPGTGGMPIPKIETDFEGGNIEVTLIDPPTWTIYARPALKGSSPYRAWFYFKMSSVSGAQPTNLVVNNWNWQGIPYFSYDDESWQRFSSASGNRFSQTFSSDPVWIAASVPYVSFHRQRLFADLQGRYAQPSLLTTSEGGRPVTMLTIMDFGVDTPRRGVWCIARQHAWEASGSWVLDGLARWLVSDDPQAERLRRDAVVHIVPIMDIDNVVVGGSGKDQQPIDFNRDWRTNAHWRAVAAAIDGIEQYAASNSHDMFLDVHCPGGHGAAPFLVIENQSLVPPEYWARFLRFRSVLLQTAGSGPMPYTGGYREFGPNYHPLWYQMSHWHQFHTYPSIQLSFGIEASCNSVAAYRSFAEGFGRALDLFFTP